VGYKRCDGRVEVSVSDNGPGIPPRLWERFRTSSPAPRIRPPIALPPVARRGNALKTIIGIPHALGCDEPIVIEAQGVRHDIKPVVDPAGKVRLPREVKTSDRSVGTKVTVSPPNEYINLNPFYWTAAFSIFNPHAFVRLEHSVDDTDQAKRVSDSAQIYKPTVSDPKKFRSLLFSVPIAIGICFTNRCRIKVNPIRYLPTHEEVV
jgi:hypothetical protein